MTKISYLGAKDCVTGSCHLIETRPGSADSINILVDCGTAYGDDPELPFNQFPIPPDGINYLFLTHAQFILQAGAIMGRGDLSSQNGNFCKARYRGTLQ